MLYLEGIKQPLEELYYELLAFFSCYDKDLLGDKRRCISSAYNDARFCCNEPIKEYFYIRFKLPSLDKKNALGFYLDGSLSGYKYGLQIYKADAAGMERIRKELLKNREQSLKIAEAILLDNRIKTVGEKYKNSVYLSEDERLRDWLDRKQIGFCYEAEPDESFFERVLLENMKETFETLKEVYFLFKKALL